jgi:hypothetical protein
VFNWVGLVNGSCSQGEYFCEKVKMVRSGGEVRAVAREAISQYETILVSRPLIYVEESGRNFKESFM